jgi:hypothetical protein
MDMSMYFRRVCFGEFIRIELVNTRFGAVAGFCSDSLICGSHESRGLFVCLFVWVVRNNIST